MQTTNSALFIQDRISGIHAFKFRNDFLHFCNYIVIYKIGDSYQFLNIGMKGFIFVLDFWAIIILSW
jgi:hypothetical protein